LQSDQTGIGSAAWICEHVGIDHARLANKVGSMRF
jgi:hypothetical protein